jgi:hypothetical protein
VSRLSSTTSFALLLLAACGDAEPKIQLRLHIASALSERTSSLALFAFGDQKSDGIYLTCGELLDGVVLPTDKRVELLGKATTTDIRQSVELRLKEVAAGPNRIVYAEALDATGTRIGAGCKPEVDVPEGEAVDVTLTVFQL